MQTDISLRIQTDIVQNVVQSTKSNQSSSLNKNILTSQFRRFMALPNQVNQNLQKRNISPSEIAQQTTGKQTQQDFASILNVQTPSTTSKKRKKLNLNFPNSRPQRINTDIYEDYANHQILLTETNTNDSTRVGSSCGKFLMPQSVKSQVRTKSVGKESVRQRTKNLVAKIYCGNSNQLSMYYDSNLTNMMKSKRNKSSQGDNINRSESSTGKLKETKHKNEFTPSTSPHNRPISMFQGRMSKLNYLKDNVKRKSVISIDNENSLFQVSKNSDTNSSINQFLETTKNSTTSNFQVQFRNRSQHQQQVKQECQNFKNLKQQHQNYLSTQSQCTSTEEDIYSQQQSETNTGMYSGQINKQGDKIIKTSSNDSNFLVKQNVDSTILQQNKNKNKKRSYTQESENLNKTTYNFLEYTKKNYNNKENSNYVYFSQNSSKGQSRMDRYKDYNLSQQPSLLYQRKNIYTDSSDNVESQKEFSSNIQSDIRNKSNISISFNQKSDSTASSISKISSNHSYNQNNYNNNNNHNNQQSNHKRASSKQNTSQNNQNINQYINENQQQQQVLQNSQYQNHQRIAQIVTQQQQQEKQQTQQIIHPKILFEMTDDEWNTFGDRFPSNFTKVKLLGRGGFALVWLGQDNKTKEQYAIKQVSTKNVHQTHIKEIWFGSQFFENGQPKPIFKNSRGINNMIRLAGYDLKPIDTWLFYELSGDSLGTNLYDLKGDGKTSDGERVYRLIYELAHALHVISDQKIVHSDLKPENILIKTRYDPKNKNKFILDQVKLIDYGSAFTFGNLKNFSMATPEYMAPEVLNYILNTNNLNHNKQLVEYLKDYNMPHVIDIWSLGCVILELINGIPLWMSLKTKIKFEGKELIKYGLFAVKNRVFESIIQKQIETINNLDTILDEQNYSSIVIDDELRNLLKCMLKINPSERISPKEIINILFPSLKGQLNKQ